MREYENNNNDQTLTGINKFPTMVGYLISCWLTAAWYAFILVWWNLMEGCTVWNWMRIKGDADCRQRFICFVVTFYPSFLFLFLHQRINGRQSLLLILFSIFFFGGWWISLRQQSSPSSSSKGAYQSCCYSHLYVLDICTHQCQAR